MIDTQSSCVGYLHNSSSMIPCNCLGYFRQYNRSLRQTGKTYMVAFSIYWSIWTLVLRVTRRFKAQRVFRDEVRKWKGTRIRHTRHTFIRKKLLNFYFSICKNVLYVFVYLLIGGMIFIWEATREKGDVRGIEQGRRMKMGCASGGLAAPLLLWVLLIVFIAPWAAWGNEASPSICLGPQVASGLFFTTKIWASSYFYRPSVHDIGSVWKCLDCLRIWAQVQLMHEVSWK